MKNVVEIEKEMAQQLSEEMQEKNDIIAGKNQKVSAMIENVAQDFEHLDKAIQAVAEGNDHNAEECMGIYTLMTDIIDFSDQLQNALASIEGLVQGLRENNEEIANVADETNLLSLNASIEAARAGSAGRGFAIIAENIKKLADSSKETATDSEVNQAEIGDAVLKLTQSAQQLISIIDNVNSKITSLAEASEQITSATAEVGEISEVLKEKMDELLR